MTSAPDQTSADNRLEFLFLLLSLGNISSWNFRIFQFWQMKFVQILSPFFFSFEELGERERERLPGRSLSFFLFIYEIKNEIENTKVFPRTITVEMSQKVTTKISFFKLP